MSLVRTRRSLQPESTTRKVNVWSFRVLRPIANAFILGWQGSAQVWQPSPMRNDTSLTHAGVTHARSCLVGRRAVTYRPTSARRTLHVASALPYNIHYFSKFSKHAVVGLANHINCNPFSFFRRFHSFKTDLCRLPFPFKLLPCSRSLISQGDK